MTIHVIVHPAAEQDITDALDWYAKRAPEQVERFLDEVAAAVRRMTGSPRLFRTVHRGVRRAALQVFPYLVWFVLEDDLVRVDVEGDGDVGVAEPLGDDFGLVPAGRRREPGREQCWGLRGRGLGG